MPAPNNHVANAPAADALDGFFTARIECLCSILASIDAEALARQDISKNMITEIDEKYRYLKAKLYELDLWGVGANQRIDQRRSRLEMQLDKLNEESRHERVLLWQDLEALARERRVWFKQYADLSLRLTLLGAGDKRKR